MNCPQKLCLQYTLTGRVGTVLARLTEDREFPGSNPTLAFREFLWTQEMNLRPRCELVPLDGGIYASMLFLGAVCWLHSNPEVK